MDETDLIKQRYARRINSKTVKSHQKHQTYISYAVEEREAVYTKFLKTHFNNLKEVRLIEIGAGEGGNISFFKKLGIPAENIYANELIPDRVTLLKKHLPEENILSGNALTIDPRFKFDVVFQSTVFTSILSTELKVALAEKMLSMLSPSGMVLWYDFTYDNPSNPDVKGVTVKEIRNLFPKTKIEVKRLTLAPPIGRVIGHLYKIINFIFPFLRTHIAVKITRI